MAARPLHCQGGRCHLADSATIGGSQTASRGDFIFSSRCGYPNAHVFTRTEHLAFVDSCPEDRIVLSTLFVGFFVHLVQHRGDRWGSCRYSDWQLLLCFSDSFSSRRYQRGHLRHRDRDREVHYHCHRHRPASTTGAFQLVPLSRTPLFVNAFSVEIDIPL